ncbi:ClpXP protease specificity-enhancing factor [Enterovibrio nigricans]|uniref:Stringent starvation protein B n=1 Tax=Enterovibrio nigricans DSM 22720 TaxID=1121868 RepID=A0A1T4TWW3_9GAMM|nr:ClpXP protease specificity-enhancing factor [Enterovibrio nigricans]PKF51428.1 ClpXP protease specificity-enhancing factor [Enterovibrio nigricans]SKA44920.1 stringent starvation protein B [Enterovibrio nigricans DSM 22720]
MDDINLTPRRPYLLRAFHDWLLDNDLTPHLVVDATLPNVNVPFEYVQDGQIVLNIAPRAVGNLELGNDEVRFNARFGGRPMTVTVPLYAVVAVYARENGAGTMFESEPAYEAELDGIEVIDDESEAVLDAVEETLDANDAQQEEAPARPKGRPTLTVVK